MSLSHSFDHYCGGQSLNDQSGRECVSIDVIVRPPEIIAHKDERIPFLLCKDTKSPYSRKSE